MQIHQNFNLRLLITFVIHLKCLTDITILLYVKCYHIRMFKCKTKLLEPEMSNVVCYDIHRIVVVA
jgi:hypothetical protein